MKDTIIRLQAEIEELKKRLSAIFISHTTADQLKSIKDYFDSVQTYLQNLTTSFDTHATSCDENFTKIAEIESQIATINETINSLPDFEGFDTTEIKTQMETLTTKVSEFETKLESLIGENDTTLDTITNDISSLQTDLGAMQDEIDSINEDISSINTDIGSMQTTITNLTATQNSLSSAQNSMSANISTLESRVTTNENNISALTGGVDVGEFDTRITVLEDANGFSNHFAYKKVDYNLTPTDFKLFTPEYYFCSTTNGYTELKLNLFYENISATTVQIEFYINKNLIKTLTVDLNKNITNYQIIYKYRAALNGQSLKLKCIADSSITYSNLEMELHGANVHFFDYDKNVKVHCFDNQVFITKIENGIAYYGAIPSTETIDLNNLPNQQTFQTDASSYINLEYVPYPVTETQTSDYFTNYAHGLVTETANGSKILKILEIYGSDHDELVDRIMSSYLNTKTIWTTFGVPYTAFIKPNNGNICVKMEIRGSTNYEYAFHNAEERYDEKLTGRWVFITPVENNNNGIGTKVTSGSNESRIVAINLDGYAYFVPRRYPFYLLKIGKGNFATAYFENETTINVYVSDFEKTDKYTINFNPSNNKEVATCSYVETINDCDCVYETFNNTIIKHIINTNTWEVVQFNNE